MNTKTTPIAVGNTEVLPLFFKDQPVITFAMMDYVHERPDGTARKAFNRNKSKLVEGDDYFVHEMDESKNIFGIHAPNGLVTLAETGYLLLVKVFTDELAWQIQRQLVKAYFSAKPTPTERPQADERLDSNDTNNLARIIWSMTHDKTYNQVLAFAIWKQLRAATDTPAPQRFRTADIPRIAAELRRLWCLANAASEFCQQAEQAFLTRCVRGREDLQSVIAEQQQALETALQNHLNQNNQILQSWHEHELHLLTTRTQAPRADYGVMERLA